MSNLMLSVRDTFGVYQDSFGDSTGRLEIHASSGSIAAFARVAS